MSAAFDSCFRRSSVCEVARAVKQHRTEAMFDIRARQKSRSQIGQCQDSYLKAVRLCNLQYRCRLPDQISTTQDMPRRYGHLSYVSPCTMRCGVHTVLQHCVHSRDTELRNQTCFYQLCKVGHGTDSLHRGPSFTCCPYATSILHVSATKVRDARCLLLRGYTRCVDWHARILRSTGRQILLDHPMLLNVLCRSFCSQLLR